MSRLLHVVITQVNHPFLMKRAIFVPHLGHFPLIMG
jgi:hypothetical protein